MAKEKCFIIAPISTVPERATLYLNDVDHCEHIIDHLLAPAVEKAGFEPVKPKAKGANLIHAEIVRNLQTASLILCDMSGLNANVFFELGIRTAMNKPICLAIDEATKAPPFDLDLVNHHKYNSDLRPWILPGEVSKLATHVEESAREKENALWKYFALRLTADAAERRPGPADKMDLLLSEVDALRRQIGNTDFLRTRRETLQRTMSPELLRALDDREARAARVRALVRRVRDVLGLDLWKYSTAEDDMVTLWIGGGVPSHDLLEEITSLATGLGIEVSIRFEEPPPEATKR